MSNTVKVALRIAPELEGALNVNPTTPETQNGRMISFEMMESASDCSDDVWGNAAPGFSKPTLTRQASFPGIRDFAIFLQTWIVESWRSALRSSLTGLDEGRDFTVEEAFSFVAIWNFIAISFYHWRLAFKVHLRREWLLFGKFRHWGPCFIGLPIVMFIENFAGNIVFMLHIPAPRFDDMGYRLIPPLPPSMHIWSEYLAIAQLVLPLLYVLQGFMFPNRPKHKQFYFSICLARACLLLCILRLLRTITFLSTILPAPADHCQPGAGAVPPETVWDILFTLRDGCGDLLFSGHMCFAMVLACIMQKYGRYTPLKVFIWCASCVLGIMIVAARKHYSVDVILAAYTVPLVFIALERYFPDMPMPKEFSKLVSNEYDCPTFQLPDSRCMEYGRKVAAALDGRCSQSQAKEVVLTIEPGASTSRTNYGCKTRRTVRRVVKGLMVVSGGLMVYTFAVFTHATSI